MTGSDQDYQAQTKYLRVQMAAILRLPAPRRRRYTVHEVFCAQGSEPLLTVLATEPYQVVRYREQSGPGVRRSDWRWFAIATPPPDPDSPDGLVARQTIIPAMCPCRQVVLNAADVYDSIRRGESRRVLHPE